MGNCVSLSIALDQSVNKVSQWLEKEGGYTHNLQKNLVALETTMEELKAKRDDLERKLKREEVYIGFPNSRYGLIELQKWKKNSTPLLVTKMLKFKGCAFVGFALRGYYLATVTGKMFS